MRFVLYHEENGVYLGNCLGMGFWSKLDPVDQPSAVTFATEAEALEHAASWDEEMHGIETRSVVADDGLYASIAACAAAGLPAWEYQA